MPDLTDLQFITLALIGLMVLVACGLCVVAFAIEPREDPLEKIDTERV